MTTTIGDAGPESGHGSDDHSDQPGGLDELLDRHGPTPIDYQQKEAVSKALQNGASIDAIVIAGDIRRSTSLMKEAVSFQVYAQIINRFVTAIQIATRSCGGWFDKFTGDGFLAFWVTTGDASLKGTVLRNVVEYARQQRVFFGELILPDLRLNFSELSRRCGFCCWHRWRSHLSSHYRWTIDYRWSAGRWRCPDAEHRWSWRNPSQCAPGTISL